MALSQVERESILLFNEGASDAEIYTFNEKLKRRLASVAAKHPEIYHLKSIDQHGAATYVFPKRNMTIKFKEPLSPEKQSEMNVRMENLRRKRAVK